MEWYWYLLGISAIFSGGFCFGTVYGKAMEAKAIADLIAVQRKAENAEKTILFWIEQHVGLDPKG